MRVELFANQRLLDTYKQRGRVAKRKRDEKPKDYPLAGDDWSSQDESEESEDEKDGGEGDQHQADGPAQEAQEGQRGREGGLGCG